MTALTFLINKTSTDSSYVSAPANFTAVEVTDALVFSAGSTIVANGQPIPTQTDYNRAATLLSPSVNTIVAHYLLADTSANLLRELFNAGQKNKQYVFCCSFDGATATEPALEAWDDATLTSANLACLGTGIPTASWYKAICTTTSLPGVDWSGTPLAGSGVSNRVLLNGGLGALTVAKDLYFNFHVNIPAGVTTPALYLPVLAIVFDTN